MTIIWCMVLEILSVTGRIFSSWTIFCPFTPTPTYGPRKSKFWKNERNAWRYHHFITVYTKWQSYDVWFLRYQTWWTELFAILDHFLPFYSPNNTKNQNFEKMKKNPGDNIILHMCTKRTIIWCMVPEIWHITDNCFVILDHFLPFYPLKIPKNQNSE